MARALLMMRLDMAGPKPTAESIIVTESDQLAVIGNQLWVKLASAEGRTPEEARGLLLEHARGNPSLARLIERLYQPPALPAGTNLMAQMEAGRRRR